MSDNPLLFKIRLPGRIFQLPSRGIFYKNGELDENVKEGEIHVRPMSALAEIHMKNPDQLFSGQAIESVFKECVSGIAKPTELLSRDVDAVMVFLRVVTYGDSYDFTARHHCEMGKEHSYIANVSTMIEKMQMIDPTVVEDTYSITMPNGQKVMLQPAKYSSMIEMVKSNEGKTDMSIDDMKNNLLQMLCSIVKQVDETTDPNHIKEWISKIETRWVTLIANKAESINEWGPSLRWDCICKDCFEPFNIELPINPVSFFTE